MTVYVVVCDCGLNGAWAEAVCSTQAAADEVAAKVNQRGRSLDDHWGDPGFGSYTGFGGAEVVAFEVDGAKVSS